MCFLEINQINDWLSMSISFCIFFLFLFFYRVWKEFTFFYFGTDFLVKFFWQFRFIVNYLNSNHSNAIYKCLSQSICAGYYPFSINFLNFIMIFALALQKLCLFRLFAQRNGTKIQTSINLPLSLMISVKCMLIKIDSSPSFTKWHNLHKTNYPVWYALILYSIITRR